MTANIVYKTSRIAEHYKTKRRSWAELYPSEQWVFERVMADRGVLGDMLDVGCAAGGLGEAITEKFPSLRSYTGVDINQQAIDAGREAAAFAVVPTAFIAADICDCPQLAGQQFGLVTALGVADWNADPEGIVAACWNRVAPGGHLIVSLRLTPEVGTCDMAKSFQYIWFDDEPIPANTECAPYNVFNIWKALSWFSGAQPTPDRVLAYGYWGKPSATARTPYEKLIFSVFALRKSSRPTTATPIFELHLPGVSLDNA